MRKHSSTAWDEKNCHPRRGTPGSAPSHASCGWPGTSNRRSAADARAAQVEAIGLVVQLGDDQPGYSRMGKLSAQLAQCAAQLERTALQRPNPPQWNGNCAKSKVNPSRAIPRQLRHDVRRTCAPIADAPRASSSSHVMPRRRPAKTKPLEGLSQPRCAQTTRCAIQTTSPIGLPRRQHDQEDVPNNLTPC